ncbi:MULTISPECIES: PLP-dependent aminotransferase family protein [Rhodomicrobium]|uniref:MocR-like pyridoxine biosynthesis transcription factor PdxR n=1 Tax=Rhodomicrobium TaxID=1068 RepID=UPI000B4AE763|nr:MULTISPECIES: PLP-dependent aminotransferase family protein [Rhodomicrobium]
MADLLSGILDLSRATPVPLHVQIIDQIKRAVLAGKLPAKLRLPSSRAMAAGLAVSRNTVMAALDQLKAEGFLESLPGSGMRVAPLPEPDLLRAKPAKAAARQHRLAPHWRLPLAEFQPSALAHPQPFAPGIPDLNAFPHEQWSTALRRAARLADTPSAGYDHMSGHPRFRQALCKHLAEARGVVAEAEQIIVTSSARGGLSLLTSALLSPGEECWVEEPGFRSAKAIFSAHGGRLVPVPVDAQGIDPSRAPASGKPRLIYTTPSHQYPTGAVMTLARRLELLDAASRAGAYIVEDDYDSEFQYRGRPIAALQGLDRSGCVLYLGTFSKSLLPAIRVGFVVVPAGLADGFRKVHRHTAQFVPPVIQLALADFLERGHYAAHVRRMKSIYSDRLSAFCEGIARHSGGALAAAMPDGGLQTVVTSRDGMADAALAAHLAKADMQGQPLGDFHMVPKAAVHRGMLMGFAAWGEAEAAKAMARLARLYR